MNRTCQTPTIRKPRRIPVKPFAPKPLTSGARIEWNERDVRRTGIVWDRGPDLYHRNTSVWVTPDVPLDTDAYGLVLVGKERDRKSFDRTRTIAGELYVDAETRSYGESAARAAARHREANRRALVAA